MNLSFNLWYNIIKNNYNKYYLKIMIEIELTYKQQITIIQCQLNNKMIDIYKKI